MLWQQNSNPKENSGKTNTGISTEDTRWKSRPALVPGGASGKGPTPSIGEARDDQGKVWSALLARDFSSEKTPAGRNTRVRADEKKNEQRPHLIMKQRSTRTEVDGREILGAEKSAPKLERKIKNNCFGCSTARSQI
jgi:hypothetical protein